MIVVDCSLVLDVLVAPDRRDLASSMAGELLAAPSVIDFEFLSALRGLVLGSRLTVPRAIDALHDFDDLRLRRWPSSRPLRARTFELRHNVSAYDAAYVVLAEALGCALMTRDRRLATATDGIVDVTVV